MNVELSQENFQFLLHHFNELDFLDKHEEFGRIKLIKNKDIYPSENIAIDIREDELDEILDALSSLLLSIGLDENDEPNSVGLKIESIIDIFAEKRY